ncbi:hypothetical protein ACFL4T_04385, partial [candidate division KSB1 bacterium]
LFTPSYIKISEIKGVFRQTPWRVSTLEYVCLNLTGFRNLLGFLLLIIAALIIIFHEKHNKYQRDLS